jgi:uncharacterized protein YjiS (DUF1127 family)
MALALGKSGISHRLTSDLATLIFRFGSTWRAAAARRQLAEMPSERLADMGLSSLAGADARNSGEPGRIPKVEPW